MQFRTIVTIITLIAVTKAGFAQYPFERREYITIEELIKNATTDTIHLSNMDHFLFHYGLKNWDKMLGKCKIFFSTDQYIYYGYSLRPQKRKEGSSYYYKVSKSDVLEKLPMYEELSYYLVDSVTQPYWTKINERYQKDEKGRKREYDAYPLDISISGQYIEVKRLYKLKHWFWNFKTVEEKKHTAKIDKNSFELISK